MVTRYKKELFLDNEILEGMGWMELYQPIVGLMQCEGSSINKTGSYF